MKWCLACLLLIPAFASAQDDNTYSFGLSNDGLLPPARHNAYGPGIESDATGRPFFWAPKNDGAESRSAVPDGTLKVKPDAYGLGVGSDQYGRPMERRSR
ncbi:MAG: hypothetical protein NT045_06105 [Candidatus Aureabacteria bacterium]|nr:hypothetical protein [Candidatus Auribacterota bacterium]